MDERSQGTVFSTRDRGGAITDLPDGATVGSLGLSGRLLAALTALLWTVLIALTLARFVRAGVPAEIVDAAGAWGWTAATLGAAAAMALTTQRLAARTERAYRLSLLTALLPAWTACLGTAAGVAVHLVRLRLAPAAPYGTSFFVPLLLLGAAVVVIVGDDGEVLVEHDPSRPPRYHPAPDRFVGAAGG